MTKGEKSIRDEISNHAIDLNSFGFGPTGRKLVFAFHHRYTFWIVSVLHENRDQ